MCIPSTSSVTSKTRPSPSHSTIGCGLSAVFRPPKRLIIALDSDVAETRMWGEIARLDEIHVLPSTMPANRAVELSPRSVEVAHPIRIRCTSSDATPVAQPNVDRSDLFLDVRPETVHLIETMRCSPATGIVNRGAHMARLTKTAADLQFTLDPVRIETVLDAWSSQGIEAVHSSAAPPERHCPDRGARRPGNLRRRRRRWHRRQTDAANACWTRHKTTHREPYEAARRRNPAVHDVILFNTAGRITESTMANVAVAIDGIWVTPAS